MKAWLVSTILLAASCTVGAPPGFSSGEVWTFPLVAPLEDDLLLVPVYVASKKEPLLFMIDPDSRTSSIDSELQAELKPYSVQVPDEIAESDHRVHVFMAEIPKIKVGDLEVHNIKMRVHNAGVFWSGGRPVRGILGRDVIADSLVLGVDRDRGVAYLGIQDALKPPPGAASVSFHHYFGRQLAEVTVNGAKTFRMHLDLGARTSMLWPARMQQAGLPHVAVKATLVDEYGVAREESVGAIAAKVGLGRAGAAGLLFLPYGDHRVDDDNVDGALGQNFFSKFNVTMNWDRKKIWLRPRGGDLIGTARERLDRWGPVFKGCKLPACVSVEVVRTDGPKEIRIHREGQVQMAYEVLLQAVDVAGKPISQPPVLATLQGGAETVSDAALAPSYGEAAAFVVIDVSPFPRPCDEVGKKCMWQLARPM